jgi:type IV pilus assembly protein PilW
MAGASLVEVMLAVALGLALTLSMATLHARVLQLSALSGRAADAQDTLRIALAILEYELAHAGYWGPVPEAARVSGRRSDEAPLAVMVGGDCGPGWAIDLEPFLQAWPGGWPLDCAPFSGAAPLSGVLVIRRTDTRVSAPDAGVLQLQADPWAGRLVADGTPADAGMETRDLVARAYYVSPHSTGEPGRPSLRRKTLQRGPRVIDEEVLPGVASLEIELGIDTDPPGTPGYGMPNRFVPPGAAAGTVVAVRVRLRSDDASGLAVLRTIPLRNGPLP